MKSIIYLSSATNHVFHLFKDNLFSSKNFLATLVNGGVRWRSGFISAAIMLVGNPASVARFSVFAPDLAFFACLSRFFKKSGAMARNDQNLVVFLAFKFYLFFLRFWRKIWCFLPYFPGFSQFFSRQDKNWDYLNYHGKIGNTHLV